MSVNDTTPNSHAPVGDMDARQSCGNPKHVHSGLVTTMDCIWLNTPGSPSERISAIAAQVERMLATPVLPSPVGDALTDDRRANTVEGKS